MDGNGRGNRKTISVEICYSASGGRRFTKAEENGAKLVAGILHRYKWGISHVKQHHYWSGKDCPRRTRRLGWNRFLKMVQSELNILNKTTTKPSFKTPFTVPTPVLYKGKQNMSITQVKNLQKMCNKCINTKLEPDGSWGTATEKAFTMWQKKSESKGYYDGKTDGSYGTQGRACAKKWYKALNK